MGATVTTIIVLKEKQIVAVFRAAGAMSAAGAVAPASIGLKESWIFRKLRNRAVIREGAPGLFYLDEPSWKALIRVRRRVALAVVLFVAAVALAIAATRAMGQAPPRRPVNTYSVELLKADSATLARIVREANW